MPVCGPCASRGIDEGQCKFVSSRRGGPRYKGVKGAEAARVKAERDRQREEQRLAKENSRRELRDSNPNFHAAIGGARTDSSGSRASASPSQDWQRNMPTTSAATLAGIHPSQAPYLSNASVLAPAVPSFNGSTYGTPVSPFSASNGANVSMPSYPPASQARLPPVQPAIDPSVMSPFGQPAHTLPGMDGYSGMGTGEMLSFANLELWQRIQERTAAHEESGAFSDFFSRLEVLPKAGIIGGGGNVDPLDVLMDWEGGEIGGNVQDNEQGVRTLYVLRIIVLDAGDRRMLTDCGMPFRLSDFYELVYPACPVLPSPGSLPSLAFYFSGKGPCGLFAAISAVVALHLPSEEAYKTLKASQHPLQRYEGSPTGASMTSTHSAAKPAEDVAAYHAKTSEFIIHQWEENKRACFMDPTAPNPLDGMDEELVIIESGAAHTLLCMYYYGSGQPLGHQRAYKHAVEGWNLMQKLDIHSKTSRQTGRAPEQKANAARPFASDIKLEWAKRVYWSSYAAATVMSCTGGFVPFGNPKDGVMDIQLRPSLEDVSAWGVMVRGAQQVSRSYRLLYELDQLRVRVAQRGKDMDAVEMQQAAMDRQTIFNAMLKLDNEIGNYIRFDAGWRDPPPEPGERGFMTADKELARSLKVAGRLMTSGSIIILHRAQAFSNARVFMEPQCGIPEAARLNRTDKVELIMHQAEMHDLQPPRLTDPSSVAHDGPSDSNGRLGSQSAWQTPVSSSQPHPFLTDRFSGGPFEPPHSLERCRFAASTMVGTLPRMLRDSSRVPKLPPYSACSYVLGAYAILMLTLLIQVRGEMAAQGNAPYSDSGHGNDAEGKALPVSPGELRMQLESHRAPVRDIIAALKKFATVWAKAVDYENEVSTLLTANEILG